MKPRAFAICSPSTQRVIHLEPPGGAATRGARVSRPALVRRASPGNVRNRGRLANSIGAAATTQAGPPGGACFRPGRRPLADARSSPGGRRAAGPGRGTHGASRPASSTSGAERCGSTRTRCRGAMGRSPRRRLRETYGRVTLSAPSSCNGSSTSSRSPQAATRQREPEWTRLAARAGARLDRPPPGRRRRLGVGLRGGAPARNVDVGAAVRPRARPLKPSGPRIAAALRRDGGGRSQAPVALLLGE